MQTVYIAAVLLSSAFALVVAAWLWEDDLDAAGRLFVLVVLLHPVTGVLVVGELLAPTRSLSVVFYGFHSAVSAGVPVAFFMFALAFASRRRRLPRPVLAVFAVYYAIVAGLEATNPLHGLAWESYEVVGESIPHLLATPTSSFTIASFPLFFLYYAAMGVIGYRFLARQGGQWQQTVALFVGFLSPFVVSSLWFVGALPGPLDGAFVIGSAWMFAFVGWAVFRYQLFDVVPLAREAVFDELDEMVVVVDRDLRLLDYNETAVETFPDLRGEGGIYVGELIPQLVDGDVVDVDGTLTAARAVDAAGPDNGAGAVEPGTGDERPGDDGTAGADPADASPCPFVSSFTAHGESSPREYTVDVSRLRADRTVQGYALVVRDVTERRRRMRELEQQKAQLERFASTLSHDLRNPLNVAEGRTEMALETGDVDHLRTAVDAHDRIHGIIDDLLTLSREGQTIDDPERVALVGVAEDAWETTDTPDATFEVAPAADVRVYADRTRLLNVFENCFRNAVEHGSTSPPSNAREDSVEHGGSDVTIRLVDHPGGFAVEDDGPGVPPEERESVFDYEYTTAETGTGLGLAIVDAIARAHGWSVEATEGSDGGARIAFSDVDVVDTPANPESHAS